MYNELEGLTALLKYRSVPVGCCGIVLHPEWQRAAYPATLFTTAPLEAFEAAVAVVAARGEAIFTESAVKETDDCGMCSM